MGSVIQRRGPQASAQSLPVNSDAHMRGFSTGGGAVVGGAGQPTDLHQRISVALRGGTRIGHTLGRRAGYGKLLDQRTERGTVLRLQEPFEPQPPIAALPQPQLPCRRGRLGLLPGLRTVLVQMRQNVPPDFI